MEARRDELERACAELSDRPLVSILIPVYNTPPDVLEATLESVFGQIYPKWEACIADDGSTREETVRAVSELASRDERVRVVRRETSGGIAIASNAAAELASGEWFALLDHDDLLEPDALLAMAMQIEVAPDADFLYSDEDKISTGGRFVDPFLKPDFSPERFLSHNYIGHLTLLRASLFREVGGFREGYDGSQDYDLFLRATEAALRIEHVPEVLYHWRIIEGSTAQDPAAKGGPWREASRRALRDAVARRGMEAEVADGMAPDSYRVRPRLTDPPRVAIVLAATEECKTLARCARSAREGTDYPDFAIAVVGPEDIHSEPRVRHIPCEGGLSLSAMRNLAARNCDAPFVLFLNQDLEPKGANWLRAMVEAASLPGVGAAGPRVVRPDGTLAGAGMVLDARGVARPMCEGLGASDYGPFSAAMVVRNVSALSGDCLVVAREAFLEVGGFDERLAERSAGVDLCLRLADAGRRCVFTPYAELTIRGGTQ